MAFKDKNEFLDALWDHIFEGDDPDDEDEKWFNERVETFFEKLESNQGSNDNSNNNNSGGNSSDNSGNRRRRRTGNNSNNSPRRQRRQSASTSGYGSGWFK